MVKTTYTNDSFLNQLFIHLEFYFWFLLKRNIVTNRNRFTILQKKVVISQPEKN